MNKKGMTLLELLVYMALAALLLAPVIMLMNTSSKNMARDASNTDLRISGRDLLNVIYDDLKNTGFKLNPETFDVVWNATYRDDLDPIACPNGVSDCSDPPTPPALYDSSSFMSHSGGPVNTVEERYDSLEVKSGKLKNPCPTTGTCWDRVDTIRYYVRERGANGAKELVRDVVNESKKQVLARNVAALQFQYSPDLIEWRDHYNTYDSDDRYDKPLVRYIKVTLVLKDNKRLAAVNNQTITVIKRENSPPDPDNDINITIPAAETGQALYERHEIVVPIPNNGLYP